MPSSVQTRARMFAVDAGHTGLTPVRHPSLAPEPAWKTQVGSAVFSAPVIVDGTIYLLALGSATARFAAWSAATGDLKWEHSVSYFPPCWWYSAAVEGERLYAADYGRVMVLHKDSGVVLAERRMGEGWAATAPPALYRGLLLVCGNDACLYALSTDTLEELWRYRAFEGPPVYSSPAAAGDRVCFFTCGSTAGSCHCVDAATGREAWTFKVPITGGVLRSSPTMSGGSVYLLAGVGGEALLAVAAESGELRWQVQLGREERTSPPLLNVSVAPAASPGSVYAGAMDGHLRALTDAGVAKWSFDSGAPIESAPALVENALYGGSDAGRLFALRPETGDLLWEHLAAGAIVASPAVDEDRVVVATANGWLEALQW
jgi:outer membrane protein assembly factor BamB